METVMMMIAPNSRAHKGGRRGGRLRGSMEKFEERNPDYGGMVQPSQQQHVAPRVKGVEWGLGTRGLKTVAAFRAGFPDPPA